jgi:hypothetical protein
MRERDLICLDKIVIQLPQKICTGESDIGQREKTSAKANVTNLEALFLLPRGGKMQNQQPR